MTRPSLDAPPLTPATPLPGQRGLTVECPRCGTAWSPRCALATPPTWDPTVGVRTTDRDRHAGSPGYRS